MIEELAPYPDEAQEYPKNNNLAALMTSKKGDYGTPQWLFDALDNEFGFTVDLAASMENRKCDKFFSVHQDAFRLRWTGTGWLNPPYGRGIDRWMNKAMRSAVEEKATVVCLVPARTDTNWWFDYGRKCRVRFLKGRVKFLLSAEAKEERRLENLIREAEGKKLLDPEGDSAPFPSALCIYQPGLPRSTSYWHYQETDDDLGYSVEQLESE